MRAEPDGPTPSHARAARPRLARRWLFLTGLILGAVATVAIYKRATRPESSPVALGERLVVRSGCYACHGRSDADARPNARRLADGTWRPKAIPTFWENGIEDAGVLADWVRNGCPDSEKEKHRQLFIQMPAYGAKHLSPLQIDAVAAWILAEGLRLSNGAGNGDLPMPDLTSKAVAALSDRDVATLGDRLSRQQGCYACHGELGQGGVQNLASLKGYIPGFFGSDFNALTEGGDEKEIRHWIDHGRGMAIESGLLGRLGRRFLEGQAIGMPAYKDRLSEGQKALLVRHLKALQASGPLSATQVETAVKELQAAAEAAETPEQSTE